MTHPNPQEGGKPEWRDYGPWETCGASIVRTQFIQGDPARPGFIIADLHSCPIDKREEISRLIAAAPAMLEALKGAIGALEFSRDYHSDLGNEEQAFCQDKLDAALKALLQATGGENGR